jgi:hypothetical protein
VVELELEPLEEVELDFSDDDELVDSELAEPLDELDELDELAALVDSRLSVR